MLQNNFQAIPSNWVKIKIKFLSNSKYLDEQTNKINKINFHNSKYLDKKDGGGSKYFQVFGLNKKKNNLKPRNEKYLDEKIINKEKQSQINKCHPFFTIWQPTQGYGRLHWPGWEACAAVFGLGGIYQNNTLDSGSKSLSFTHNHSLAALSN